MQLRSEIVEFAGKNATLNFVFDSAAMIPQPGVQTEVDTIPVQT